MWMTGKHKDNLLFPSFSQPHGDSILTMCSTQCHMSVGENVDPAKETIQISFYKMSKSTNFQKWVTMMPICT